jgi:hypothetical protein
MLYVIKCKRKDLLSTSIVEKIIINPNIKLYELSNEYKILKLLLKMIYKYDRILVRRDGFSNDLH